MLFKLMCIFDVIISVNYLALQKKFAVCVVLSFTLPHNLSLSLSLSLSVFPHTCKSERAYTNRGCQVAKHLKRVLASGLTCIHLVGEC